MSKLNAKPEKLNTVVKVAAKHNLAVGQSANGNLQFKKEPLQHLYELTVGTLFGKDTYYRSSNTLVQSLRQEVRTVVDMGEYDFIANLAIHARIEMNIRSIPIVLVVEFAKALSDKRQHYLDQVKKSTDTQPTVPAKKVKIEQLKLVANEYTYVNMRSLVCDVIQRADQITDLYAYALDVFGDKKRIPMAIKRGVADAMNKFSEYHYAKYNRGNAVKFRDVLRIVHPVAKDKKQGELFKKIMEDTLETPYTWETELSKNGQLISSEKKSNKQIWTELVQSGKMGYMGLLRNLRNIAQAGVDSNIIRTYVTDVISDPERVAKSKQLTFDFVEAYKAIAPYDLKMATAVSKAIDISTAFLPRLGERIWIIIDYSGSMGNNTEVAINTATILAAALLKANEGADNLAVTLFGTSAKTLRGVDTNNSVLTIQKELLSHRKGSIAGSTNFRAALEERHFLGFAPDTIVVFSDGEVNGFPYSILRQATHGTNVVKITTNLNAATTSPFVKQEGWFTMAGWSSAMFKWIPLIRQKESITDRLCLPYRAKSTILN